MIRGLKSVSVAVLLLIIAISAVVYFNSLSNPFQFDDEYYVSNNLAIRDISNVKEVFLRPKLLVRQGWPAAHYRPLVFSSYALNYYLGGENPAGYHLVNLFLHAGSAFLIFLMIQAMTSFSIALPSTLIFAVHPFNSEIVNYITARSSVMSSFFFLLAFYCWVQFRSQESGVRGQKRFYFYTASLLAFLLAMLSKEIAVTLPVVLWLYDLYFVPVKSKVQHVKRLIAYLPFVLLVVIPALALRFFFMRSLIPRFKRSIAVQLYTELPVLLKYLKLMFLPTGLNIDHPVDIYNNFFVLPVIGSYLLLMSLLFLAIGLAIHKTPEWRIVSFFILWFFVVFLPTTIFPLNTILQENRGYLSVVSFAVFGGVLFGKVLRQSLGIRSLTLLFSLIIIIYSVGTISRNRVWKDGLSLWSDAMAKGSNSLMAYTHLSKEYILRKEYTRGEELLSKSIKLYPGDFYSHYNLSYVYYKTDRYEAALKEAHIALKIFPAADVAHVMLGLIYYAMGDLKMADEYYENAVELNSNNMEAHFYLGVIHETTGPLDQAIGHYHEVINRAALNRELAEAAAKRLKKVENQSKTLMPLRGTKDHENSCKEPNKSGCQKDFRMNPP